MPWTAADAPKFNSSTKKSASLQETWAKTANEALKKYRDEGRAIRVANSVVRKAQQK